MLEANKVSGKPNITLHSTVSNKRGGPLQHITYFTAKKLDKERSLSLSNVICSNSFFTISSVKPKCMWNHVSVLES